MYKYMREENSNEYGILELQDKILELMAYIDKLCKDNKIEYFLHGGSALGAVRHNGFIPWDDDLDIFMNHENYERFIKVCEEKLDKEKYYLQKENTKEFCNYYTKIRINGTTYIEEANKNKKDMHQGIFIDIFCADNAAKTKIGRKMQYYAAGLLKAKALSKVNYNTPSYKKRLQIFFSKIIVVGPIKKFLLWFVKKNNKYDSESYCLLFGRGTFEKVFFPKKYISEQKFLPFERMTLPVPINVEKCLEIQFGPDYMVPKKYDIHNTFWSIEKDYKEVTKDI